MQLTGIRDANLDVSASELRHIQVQSLLEPIKRAKLDIAKAFRPPFDFILDYSNTADLTIAEKFFNMFLCSIEG